MTRLSTLRATACVAVLALAAVGCGSSGAGQGPDTSDTSDTSVSSLTDTWPDSPTPNGCAKAANDVGDDSDDSALFIPNSQVLDEIDCASLQVQRVDVGVDEIDDQFLDGACPPPLDSSSDCSFSVIAVVDIDGIEPTAFKEEADKPTISFDLSPLNDQSTSDCVRLAALDPDAGCEEVNSAAEQLIVWKLYRVEGEGKSMEFKEAGDALFEQAEVATGKVDHFSRIALVAVQDVGERRGLVGRWTFDSEPVADVVNGRPATVVGEPSSAAAGAVGAGGSFSNGSYYESAAPSIGTGDLSVSLWLRTTTATGGFALDTRSANSGPNATGYLLGLLGPAPIFQLNSGGDTLDEAAFNYVGAGSGLTDGDWHHVAVTVDRDGEVSMYVDGSQVLAEAARFEGADFDSETLLIGTWRDVVGSQDGFDGDLDEVEIVGRVLRSEEVAAIAASGTGEG